MSEQALSILIQKKKKTGFSSSNKIQSMFWRTFCPVTLPINVEHPQRALEPHTLLGDTNDLVVVLAERNAFHCCWEFPCV